VNKRIPYASLAKAVRYALDVQVGAAIPGSKEKDMKSRRAVRVGSLFVLVATISGYASGQTLKKVAAIDLPGPKGQRFDYLTMDDEDGYLLSAHLGPGIL
jgi:hypothetical protein